MQSIPDLQEGERFEAIEGCPGYFLSNHKRVYSSKSNKFLRLKNNNTCFTCSAFKKSVGIHLLWNKYFNQPDEMNLIAIIRYNDYYFRHYYFDRSTDKLFHYVNGIYVEVEAHPYRKNYHVFRVGDARILQEKLRQLYHL